MSSPSPPSDALAVPPPPAAAVPPAIGPAHAPARGRQREDARADIASAVRRLAREAAWRAVDGLGAALLACSSEAQRRQVLAARSALAHGLARLADAFDRSFAQARAWAPVAADDSDPDSDPDADPHAAEAAELLELIEPACCGAWHRLQDDIDTVPADGSPRSTASSPLALRGDAAHAHPRAVVAALAAGVRALTPDAALQSLLRRELGRSAAAPLARFYAGLCRTAPGARAGALRQAARLRQASSGVDANAAAPAAPVQAAAGASPAALRETRPELAALIRRLHADAALRRTTDAADDEPPNLIARHHSELHACAPDSIGSTIVDAVARLVDALLEQPLPPALRQALARLQWPLLHVAVADASFFTRRTHPLRRFIDRAAAHAQALAALPGAPPGDQALADHFLLRVRMLCEDIAAGDFDRAALYQRALERLQREASGVAAALLERRCAGVDALLEEALADLRLRRSHRLEISDGLATHALPPFLFDFFTGPWSDALVAAVQRGGEGDELAQQLRAAARELALGVHPLGHAVGAQAFVQRLPRTIKRLQRGLDLIDWPQPARKAFFAQLLPAFGESLRTQAPPWPQAELLAQEVAAVFARPLPAPDSLAALADAGALEAPWLDELRLPVADAQRLGFVDAAVIEAQSRPDIDLGAPSCGGGIDATTLLDGSAEARRRAPSARLATGLAVLLQLDGITTPMLLAHISRGRELFVFLPAAEPQAQLQTPTPAPLPMQSMMQRITQPMTQSTTQSPAAVAAACDAAVAPCTLSAASLDRLAQGGALQELPDSPLFDRALSRMLRRSGSSARD